MRKKLLWGAGLAALLAVFACAPTWAQEAADAASDVVAAAAEEAPAAPTLDSGNTAWMLTSMVLVLFMTIPGLSLFYAGLVRKKNVLSVLMQCFALTAFITLLWVIYGYSLAFSVTGMEEGVKNLYSFIGAPDNLFLKNLSRTGLLPTGIPESVFICFQVTFAIITPALILGAFAERMKFSAMLIFSGIWFTLAYLPVCHMAWAGVGGLFWDWSVLDFAGGTVVHINAGIAALVCAIVVGPRKGFPDRPMPPHNLTMAVTGAGMLWCGWFGFNAGSAVAANEGAGMAMIATHVATAAAALTWMFIEWVKNGKPSALGIITGAVAGLVAITPASGTAGVPGALLIGVAAGIGCFLGATTLKKLGGYDDSLDAFGVHGVGGIIGAILTGVACNADWGGAGYGAGIESMGAQLMVQLQSVIVTIVISAIAALIGLMVAKVTVGLRPTDEEEEEGLDVVLHGEEGYII